MAFKKHFKNQTKHYQGLLGFCLVLIIATQGHTAVQRRVSSLDEMEVVIKPAVGAVVLAENKKPSERPKVELTKTKTKEQKAIKKAGGPKATVASSKKTKKIAQIARKLQFAKTCKRKFVSKKGFGQWGQFVKTELSTGRYPQLLKNDRAFRQICPGFRKMNIDEKKDLWVLILMSMSHFESSCRPTIEAQGPNGIAKGLFQLHEGAENKYTHWDTRGVCEKGDANHPKESLQCTMSMLNGQVRQYGKVFYQGSYWEVLRNVQNPQAHAAKIKRAIQMLPACRFGTLAALPPASSSSKKNSVKL